MPVESSRRWVPPLSILLAAILLCWPAVLNRGPFTLPDTATYFRTVDAAFVSATGVRTVWSDRIDRYTSDAGAPAAKPTPMPAGTPPNRVASGDPPATTHPPLLGRSIYFGALIYGPGLIAFAWGPILLQAAIIATTLWLFLFALFPEQNVQRRSRRFLTATAVLSLFTPAAYSASLVMPDFLSGTAILAVATLMLFWSRFGLPSRAFLIAVVTLAALGHSSNLPLIAGLAAVGALLRIAGAAISWRATALTLATVAIGLGGDMLFATAVAHKTGSEPIRPPFLTARLIADGPGYDYITHHCAGSAFEVCRHRHRLPYDSDLFLWSTDDRDGVFSTTDHATQRRLSAQDSAFALATLRAYPLATATGAARSALRQLSLIDMRGWRQAGAHDATVDQRWAYLPPPVAGKMAQTRASSGVMPIEPVQSLTIGTLYLACVLWIALMIRQGITGKMLSSRWLVLTCIVAAGILGNAAITGALSKPDARYNLRVIWVFPLVVAACAVASANRSSMLRRDPSTPAQP